MRLERWVLPPAIAAAVFTTVAIVPPGGAPARGLRVEQLTGPVDATHPLLVRAAIEDALSTQWDVPRETVFRVRAGPQTIERRVAWLRGVPYAFAAIPVPSESPFDLEVRGEEHVARVRAVSQPLVPVEWTRAPVGEGGIDLRVEGGALVPEVPGTVLVRLTDAIDGDVQLRSADNTLQITPASAHLDQCGIAAFGVTLRGLDAHVIVQLPSAGPERVARRALPVAVGGLAMRVHSDTTEIATPIGGQALYVIHGDLTGAATGWEALRFDDTSDTNATLRVPNESAAWVVASLSPVFEQPNGVWVRPPRVDGCNSTSLADRFARADTSLPRVPAVRVIFDGAAIARDARAGRQSATRSIALALAMAAIAMLVGLIVAASARRDSDAMREIALSARARAWVAFAGSAVLLLGGLILLGAFVLRH